MGRIFIDLDDVTFDLARDWLWYYNWRRSIRGLFGITHEEFFSEWDMEKNWPGAFDVLNIKGLFLGLRPFPGAVESINELRKKHDVLFLTSGLSQHAASEKLMCVENTFDYAMKKNTIVAHRKDVFGGPDDLLIDDRPDNVQGWGGHSVLVRRYHNRDFIWDGNPKRQTAKDWPEIMQAVAKWHNRTCHLSEITDISVEA